jgi:hypothetical protein
MHNPIVSIKNKPPIPYKNEGGINSIRAIPLAKHKTHITPADESSAQS